VALRPDEYANLKGKPYPLFRGVLREAHENGLLELSVKLLEAPSAENGQTAICEATAVFPGENGRERIFTEIGDCNERNCTPMIAAHRIRMAATRAKGRALRDALGIGEALMEELGGSEETAGGHSSAGDMSRVSGGTRREAAPAGQSRARGSSAPVEPAPSDSGETERALAEGAAAGTMAPLEFFCDQCGVEVEPKVAEVGLRRWNRTVCVAHGKELAALEKANVPAGAIAA